MTTTVFVLSSITAHKATFIFVNIVTHCNLKEGADPYREWSFSLENNKGGLKHTLCAWKEKPKYNKAFRKVSVTVTAAKTQCQGHEGPASLYPTHFNTALGASQGHLVMGLGLPPAGVLGWALATILPYQPHEKQLMARIPHSILMLGEGGIN